MKSAQLKVVIYGPEVNPEGEPHLYLTATDTLGYWDGDLSWIIYSGVDHTGLPEYLNKASDQVIEKPALQQLEATAERAVDIAELLAVALHAQAAEAYVSRNKADRE